MLLAIHSENKAEEKYFALAVKSYKEALAEPLQNSCTNASDVVQKTHKSLKDSANGGWQREPPSFKVAEQPRYQGFCRSPRGWKTTTDWPFLHGAED